jgi:Rnl2 family RNA ligase
MTVFHKYPETVALNKRPEILAVKQVVACEKLHGTNFRVLFPTGMKTIGDVLFGGRNETYDRYDKTFYGGRPAAWFTSRPQLLQALFDLFVERGFSDVAIYGEACGAGIQKGVRYVAGDEVVFRAFDIMIGDNFVTYDLFVEICDAVGLPRTPEVWRGEPSLPAFDALLEKSSLEAGRNGVQIEEGTNVMEGVVIRSNPLLRNVFGDWLIIKHKSEKFEEVSKERRLRSTQKGRENMAPVEEFARDFVVAGRILNAQGRLRDAGETLTGDMQDMPKLVPAIVADLHKECEVEWQTLLEQGFNDKQIRGAVSKTLGAVLRRMLLEETAGVAEPSSR